MILENNAQCQFNECNIVDRCVVSIGRHPIKMYDYFKKEPYRSNMLRRIKFLLVLLYVYFY